MRAVGATLDWYGCATFRLTIGELVVFLDAYIDRAPSAPGTGLRADDIDRADWVVVGHSHFDHLWGAERIARNTGATVIGSYETTRILAHLGVPGSQLISVSGGERVRLADDVVVGVFPSLHSCVWSHAAMGASDAVCLGDLGLTYQQRDARMAELTGHFATLADDIRAHLAASQQGARGDGGALVYVFETPDGSVLYQDTSGHWSGILHDLRPDVAILAAAGRGNIDGEPVQGTLAQFVARQASLLKPRRVVLAHHDDWLPGFSTATDVGPIRDELGRWAPWARLDELSYLDGYRPFT
jgi:L-ascorbate metabolism protein UlaG (beta-lactamase superfamily)